MSASISQLIVFQVTTSIFSLEPPLPSATIHHSRTIMYEELSRIVENGKADHSFIASIDANAFGKTSKSGQLKTKKYLLQLYLFDAKQPAFSAFLVLWDECNQSERRLLAFLLALRRDSLLRESIDYVITRDLGTKLEIEGLKQHIRKAVEYSDKTLHSVAQNIASSWKQAGFIEGKVRNIRVKPIITYRIVAFAIALGVYDALGGEFLMRTPYIKALGLGGDELSRLMSEARIRDLIKYQQTGGVIAISLTKKLSPRGE